MTQPDALPMLYPRYPFPAALIWHLVHALILGQRRSFRADSQKIISRLHPPLQVEGLHALPPSSGVVFLVNHYSRPGFDAWWLALAISAVVPCETHWTMTAAWTFPGRWYAGLLRPFTGWLFPRLASIYGFTSMPPMPPDPRDAPARAAAVRQVMAYVRRTPQPCIGLSPEGQDFPGGVLGMPSPGVGRFLLHLSRQGLLLVPVGAYEHKAALCLRFGESFSLQPPDKLTNHQQDAWARRIVMQNIARQLPLHLRGEFNFER